MMYQFRSSGGMWIRINGKNIVIDPGPGALVKICEMLPYLDPTKIDAIILTHRHLDHSNDLNVLVESMTFGGRTTRGTMILPEDSLVEDNSLLLEHLRGHVERLETWKEEKIFDLNGNIRIKGTKLKHHGVDCFGFTMESGVTPPVGVISDTRLQDDWIRHFSDCEILIANITLRNQIERIDHLSMDEVPYILSKLKPSLMLITHMGTSILEAGPDAVVGSLGIQNPPIVTARDGMIVDLSNNKIVLTGNTNDDEVKGKIRNMAFHRSKKGKHKGGR